MSSIFDDLEALVFDNVNRVYGTKTPVTWDPFDGSPAYSGKVLFNNPTTKQSRDRIEYVVVNPWIEYLRPAFPGLKESVDATTVEIITIEGVEYYVRSVQTLKDGNEFHAFLELVNSDYGQNN